MISGWSVSGRMFRSLRVKRMVPTRIAPEGDHVQDALGDDRAGDLALARAGALVEQHHAQRLARARGKDVVAHVADRGEAVAVAARGLDLAQPEDVVPALGAHGGRRSVDTSASASRASAPALSGNLGASWWRAHQMTAPSATSDRAAWMSARRRFIRLQVPWSERRLLRYPLPEGTTLDLAVPGGTTATPDGSRRHRRTATTEPSLCYRARTVATDRFCGYPGRAGPRLACASRSS